MFKIEFTNSDRFCYRDVKFEWYLGGNIPRFYPESVISLYASDKELDYIYRYFRGIPSRMSKNEVLWTGVYAQFIYDNL